MKSEFDVAVREPSQKTVFKEALKTADVREPAQQPAHKEAAFKRSEKHSFHFRCDHTKSVEMKMRYHP